MSKVSGTTASSADLVDGAPPRQKATQADVTRTLMDAAGTVVSSVHLAGSMRVPGALFSRWLRPRDGRALEPG